MNNLVQTNKPITMCSSELSDLLNMEKKEVNRKVKDMFKSEIDGGEITPSYDERGYVSEFHLPEVESTMFVAKWHSPFLRKISEFWVNKKNKAAPQIPTNFAEALQLAADQAKQLELAAPKVAFVDNLVDRSVLMNATQVAQKHKKSAQWLNKILIEFGVYNRNIKRGKDFNQWFVDKGLGEMKESEAGYSQALFTNAGEVWVNEKLHTEGIV